MKSGNWLSALREPRESPSARSRYDYEEIGALVERYREEGISWKYSSALVNPGEKIYVGSTVDGTGDEIKIFKRVGLEIKSVNQLTATLIKQRLSRLNPLVFPLP